MRYTLPGAAFVPATDPSLGVRWLVFVAAAGNAVQELIGDIEIVDATQVARVHVIETMPSSKAKALSPSCPFALLLLGQKNPRSP
jgi:hypothetical protein